MISKEGIGNLNALFGNIIYQTKVATDLAGKV